MLTEIYYAYYLYVVKPAICKVSEARIQIEM